MALHPTIAGLCAQNDRATRGALISLPKLVRHQDLPEYGVAAADRLLLGQRLAVAGHDAIATLGDNELRPTLCAEVSLSSLVCHPVHPSACFTRLSVMRDDYMHACNARQQERVAYF